MARGPHKAPYPSFSLIDHLHVLIVSLCSSCLCVGPRTSSSPPASPRLSGELDALLEPLDDNDRADALSLHSQYGRGRGRRQAEKRRKEISLAGFSLFGRRQRDESPDADTDEDEELRPAFVVDEDDDEREAHAITMSTLDQLPELAQRWEPTVTLQDLQQEEDRLAELERQAERAGGLDIYSPPISKAGQTCSGIGGGEDDFGDFETAGEDYSGNDRTDQTSVIYADENSSGGYRSTAADDTGSLEATESAARSEGTRAANVDARHGYLRPARDRNSSIKSDRSAASSRLSSHVESKSSVSAGSPHLHAAIEHDRLSTSASVSDAGSVSSIGSRSGGNPLPRPRRRKE